MRPKHQIKVNSVLNKGCANVYSPVFKPNSDFFLPVLHKEQFEMFSTRALALKDT